MEEIFLQNKYTKWYFSIIGNAISQMRIKTKDNYYEKHHIIPKCNPFNGTNDKENIVLLTSKEHFICHLLLTKMCEGIKKYKMVWALHKITYGNSDLRKNYTSKSYELIRKIHVKNLIENHYSKNNPEDFSLKMKNAALESWKDNDKRRKSASLKRSEYINKNYDSVVKQAKIASKIGAEVIKRKWEEDKDWAESQRKLISSNTSGSKNPMYGKKIEGEHLRKLSEATANKRWLNKDGKNIYVNSELVETYLKEGYTRGKLQRKKEKGESLND